MPRWEEKPQPPPRWLAQQLQAEPGRAEKAAPVVKKGKKK